MNLLRGMLKELEQEEQKILVARTQAGTVARSLP